MPEDRPWAEPAHEAILEGRSEVSWSLDDLPLGLTLRLAAGAPGYSTEQGAALTVSRPGVTRHTVRLTRLQTLEGRVVGPDGAPLFGAEIGQVRAFVDGLGLRLSDLGRSHLLSTWKVATDDDGRFRLPLDPRGGLPVIVRAPGRSPRSFSNLTPQGPRVAPTDFLDVRLAPGASLEMELGLAEDENQVATGETAGGPGRRWIELVPRGEPEMKSEIAVLLRQPLPEAGEWRPRWPALPPGHYDVRVRGALLGAHRRVPESLGTVALAAGATERVRRVLPMAAATVQEAEGTDRDLRLLVTRTADRGLDGLVATLWRDGGTTEINARVERVSGGFAVTLPGACRAGARVVLTTADGVGATEPIEPVEGDCDAPTPIALSPRGELRALLFAPRPADGERLPLHALLEVSGCPPVSSVSGAAPRSVEIPVALVPPPADTPPRPERARLAAPLPVDCRRTVLSVGAFALVPVPRFDATPGVSVDLGQVQLEHGGSILARVTSADGIPLEGARLDAWPHQEPTEDGRPRPIAPEVLRLTSGLTGPQGWVRLYGLPAGEVELALQGADRRLAHRPSSIYLRPRQEAVLDPLVLPPPASLLLEVELADDLVDRGYVPWAITLERTGGEGAAVISSLQLNLEGGLEVEVPEIPPGDWLATGYARQDPPHGGLFPLPDERLEIEAGERQRVRLVFDHEVFEGRVTLRGQPVPGRIALWPLPVDDRRVLYVGVDDDGRFEVPLERAGRYRVEVESEELGLDASVPEVTFDDPDREVLVELPGGRIDGRLITADGSPVGQTRVSATAFQDVLSDQGGGVTRIRRLAVTAADGAFEMDALPGGRWRLSAEGPDGLSADLALALAPDEWTQGVELVLDESTPASGRLVGPGGGPVVGAGGTVLVPSAQVGLVNAVGLTTDAEGRFEIPAETPDWKALLQIRLPDGSWTVGRVTADQPTAAVGGSPPGSLEVFVAGRWGRANPAAGLWLVDPTSGAHLDLLEIGRRLMADDGSVDAYLVERLSPGRWVLVQTPDIVSLDALFRGVWQGLPRLGEATLAAGSGALIEIETPE